ncbi:MAG: hypothetical protein V8Q75_03355 [Bacilli bacterium]
MLNVSEYIQLILKKKKWTLKRFADEINKIKQKVGITSITTPQNISNFLKQVDNQHILRPKMLCLWEKALGLPQTTLTSMVAPVGKEGQKELKEIMKKVGEIK